MIRVRLAPPALAVFVYALVVATADAQSLVAAKGSDAAPRADRRDGRRARPSASR
jgi:hypothetical protein